MQPTRVAGKFLLTLFDDLLGHARMHRDWGSRAPDDVRIRDAGGRFVPDSLLVMVKLVIGITGLMLCSCIRGSGEPPGMDSVR